MPSAFTKKSTLDSPLQSITVKAFLASSWIFCLVSTERFAGMKVLLVPFLHYVLKDDTKVAHASAILIMLPISIISALLYIIKGQFVFDITLPVLIGSAIGGIIGAILLKKLKSNIIIIIFSIVLVASGIYMFVTL